MKRRKRWQGRLLLVVAACAAPVADAGAALDAARAAAAAKKGSAKKGPSAADRARAAQARATGAKPAKADAPRATPVAKDAPRTATPIQGKRSAAGEIAAAKAAAAKARAAAAAAPPPPPPPPPVAAKPPPPLEAKPEKKGLFGFGKKKEEPPPPPPPVETTATTTVQPPVENNETRVTPQAKKTGVETSASVYKRLEQANTSQLLDLVLKVPLRSFELAHDSRTGRRQLGALGEDLEYFMPEAVNVGRRAFPDPDDPRKAIYVENFAHVDATVLFMHSLGATQELARRQEVAEQALVTLSDAAQRTQQRLEVVRRAAEAERVAACVEIKFTARSS